VIYPKISALNVLLCLPLLACTADRDDTDTTPATVTDASAGTGTSTSTTTATATDATTMQPTTGEGATGQGTTVNATTGEATTGEATTGEATATAATTGDATTGAGTTGESTTGAGTTGEDTSTGEPAGLSWALDVYPVTFANACVCHENGAGGLTMTNAADSYPNLVGFQAYGSGLKRVESGDPDASFLLYKLRATQEKVGFGKPMPMVGDFLPKEKIDLIEQWILEGTKP
jgi:hypothetical protein